MDTPGSAATPLEAICRPAERLDGLQPIPSSIDSIKPAVGGAVEVETATLGRPTDYEPVLAERVTQAIAGGMLLREVGEQDWAPDHATIYRWAERHQEFRDALARVRVQGASRLAQEAVALVDAVEPDSEYGGHRVAKAREQAGLRRWLAGCLDRDTYGERAQVDLKGTVAILTAFVGSTVKPSNPAVDAECVPHVKPPDPPAPV